MCRYGVTVCLHSNQGTNLNSQAYADVWTLIIQGPLPTIHRALGRWKGLTAPWINTIKNGE